MSLQVWLPLISNTGNIGASSISGELTHSSITYETGKIGNAIRINNYMTSTATYSGIANKINWSICVWLKLSSSDPTPSYQDFFTIGLSNGGETSGGFRIEHTNVSGNFQIVVPKSTTYGPNANGWYTFYSDSSSCKDKWAHIVVTNDGINFKTYINGVLKNTIAISTFTPTTSMLTGTVRLGLEGAYCWMNDLRIYDHCLSKREIHEISKGLVVHYMLSKPDNPNYFLNSNFYNSTTTSWYGVNSSSPRIETKDGHKCITGTKGTTNNICGQTLSGYSYVANSQVTFTISADVYVEETGTFGIGNWISTTEASGWQGMSGQMRSNTPMDLKVGWNHVSATRINGSNQYNGSIVTAFAYTGTTYWMTNVKFEFGDKETPWLPNSTETAIYTFMGYDTNQELDCSGYQNNGNKFGTITSTSDSPRNSSAMQFPGQTTTYIQAPSMSIDMNNATFSIWAKWTTFNTWSRIFDFGEKTSGGGYAFLVANNGSILTVAGRLSGGASLPDTQIQTIATNTWYHIAVTINNAECKTYINGSLVKTFNFNSAMGRASFLLNYLGKSNWSSDAAFAGILSDFRVYVTTLSADDILELYNAPINFNKHSTMIQGEFLER